MKKYISYTLAFVISATTAFAQQIKSGGFSPEKIRPNETSKYVVVLEGLNGSISPSSIPMPDGLRIVGTSRSQKFSMINGKTSSQTELIFIVQASAEGEYTVPEWAIEYDSKKFPIKAAKLIVDKNATPTQQSVNAYRQTFRHPFFDDDEPPQTYRRQSLLQNLSEHVSLKLETPKEKIYVGEAIPCKLVFSYSTALAGEGVKLTQLFPQVNKSDAFDCTLFEDKYTTKTDEKDGKITISYEILITPLKAGTYNLDFNAKGVFLQEFRMDSFFSMPFARTNQVPFETSTEDQKLTISPLPEVGKPDSFSGAIGKFSLTNVNVSPDSMSDGEPCVVSVDIVGMGNFARVNAPTLEKSPEWKTYRPKSSFTDESNGMGYVGIKHFKYTIVPTKADITKTPNLTFSYFDPEKGEYKTAVANGASVSVAPSGKIKQKVDNTKTETSEKSKPAFEEIISSKNAKGENNLFANPIFWVFQAVFISILIIFLKTRSEKIKLENDPTYAKKIRAKKDVAKFLKASQKSTSTGDIHAFLEASRKAIQNAIAANCDDCESDAVLLNKAQSVMIENGFSVEDIETVSLLFTAIDAINYGNFDKSSIDIQKLSAQLKQICKKFNN